MIVQPDGEGVGRAVAQLRAGRLVAFPTETVYGLGADALRPEAVEGVFSAKGRPAGNPLIVHVDGAAMAERVADWTEAARRLAARFWPGPLTLVLPATAIVPAQVIAGGDTVAVRAPDHPVALELIGAFGGPLVAPSANRSGAVSPTTAAHVEAAFPEILVLDGGPCRAGLESTVLDLTGPPAILRPGPIGPAAIAAELGVTVAVGAGAAGVARSPGLLGRHYAPARPVRLLGAGEVAAPPAGVAWLALDRPPGAGVIAMPPDGAAYAARLYAALREADASGAGEIWIDLPGPDRLGGPEGDLWAAIVDRLTRAAASP
ncbi:MAG: L-threonylcarbamoyladenylate synthase [Phycisphaerales bacterium JB039]